MMMRRLQVVALVLITVFAARTLVAQESPSTPEQRKRAVEIATLLENDPFNKNAKKLSSELLAFIIGAPDIHVHICSNVLGDFYKIKSDHSPMITAALTFSQTRFVIEHPEQADDRYQEYLAGVEGVLRTYEKIKIAKPKAKSEPLEDLLVKQQAGQLGDFVKTTMTGCK